MTSEKLRMENSDMTERRSLTTAVNSPIPGVDPEIVRSFVTQKPTIESANAASITGSSENRRSEISTVSDSSNPAPNAKLKSKRRSRFQPVGLIPITVRLRPEIAGALKRVSLERELDGEEVFTQQDIVEISLEQWLRQKGCLE